MHKKMSEMSAIRCIRMVFQIIYELFPHVFVVKLDTNGLKLQFNTVEEAIAITIPHNETTFMSSWEKYGKEISGRIIFAQRRVYSDNKIITY